MVREEAENMEIDGVEKPSHRVPDDFNTNYLKIYYGNFFPYADMYKWMSYGNDGKHPGCDQSYFGRREFSFTLENEIYLRFQSFNNVAELENSIKEKCPVKIDIGPVYNVDPAKRHAYDNFTPVERELIFDIDISDYDDVRFCCSGADVCAKCWPLMTVAIKIIDTALRGTKWLYKIMKWSKDIFVYGLWWISNPIVDLMNCKKCIWILYMFGSVDFVGFDRVEF